MLPSAILVPLVVSRRRGCHHGGWRQGREAGAAAVSAVRAARSVQGNAYALFIIRVQNANPGTMIRGSMLGIRFARGFIRNWLGARRSRGVVVPFESPVLRMARVCEDERDGLIAILRDFANNGTAYIVPWSSLPLVVPMSDYDKALHTGVAESRPTTPAEVRAVVSQLALSGALGREAKACEVERTRSARTQLADIELVLILHLLSSCGADPTTLIADSSRRGATGAKAAVAAAAAAIGVRRKDIYRRISEFSKLLEPVGLIATEGPIHAGWLRALHNEVEAFGPDCAMRRQANFPGVSAALAPIARSAARTAQFSATELNIIDYSVLDINSTISRWNTEQPLLKQVITRLSFALDEWPSLIKAAHDALRDSQSAPVPQLHALSAVLPGAAEAAASADSHAAKGQAEPAPVARALAVKLSTIWSMLGSSRPSLG
jgi:hypothetical protein